MNVPPDPHIVEQWNLTRTRFEEWVSGDLFHLDWWLLLTLFIATAVLWWKLVDKSRLAEMMLYNLIVLLFVIVLDELGEELTLWYYSVDVIFLFPPITAVDVTCLPLVYMLIYQRFTTWKSFVIATVVMAVVFCFVCEPVFVWAGVYKMLTWRSWYGLPLYSGIAFIGKAIVNRLHTLEVRHGLAQRG